MHQYEPKSNCSRVILSVLAGAHKSLAGLRWRNHSVILMPVGDYIELLLNTLGPSYGMEQVGVFKSKMFEHGIYCANYTTDSIVVLESVLGENEAPVNQPFVDALKLYKPIDIFSCYFLSYKYDGVKISSGGVGRVNIFIYSHSMEVPSSSYRLSEEEKAGFPAWLDRYYGCLLYRNQNELYQKMLSAYYTSYLLARNEQAYITLFSVLEMLFGEGQSEITYKISRGTALLLADSRDAMEDAYEHMKKLYDVRSKFVHKGKEIQHDKLCELREYVRLVLVKLIDLGYYRPDADFKRLRRDITLGGFGSFNE